MDSLRESTVKVDEDVGVLSVTPCEKEDETVIHVNNDEQEGTLERRNSDQNCHMSSDEDGTIGVFLNIPESNDSSGKRLYRFLYCGKESDSGPRETRGGLLRKVTQKIAGCPGLGLLYTFVASVFFSTIALIVKKIEGVHAVEMSAIRCFFQIVFVLPCMIYYKIDFLGPKEQRISLVLRGLMGSSAMILIFYAVQLMPLADVTVIVFSNPVFTSLLACVFLKERCTLWDLLLTVFTLTGVVLIARPRFLFGSESHGIEGNYTDHIKGTIAAFVAAVAAASTLVVLRKMGKGVHYYLSMWYYAVIGLIECLIALIFIDDWTLPPCGWERWLLMLIALLGLLGQVFITKALQIEKAGPVALMRTMDVMLAFLWQFFFLGISPTWWSLGGALCVISSTSGMALKKWCSSSRKKLRKQ